MSICYLQQSINELNQLKRKYIESYDFLEVVTIRDIERECSKYIINDNINYIKLTELSIFIKKCINNFDNQQDFVILLLNLNDKIFKNIRQLKLEKLYNKN